MVHGRGVAVRTKNRVGFLVVGGALAVATAALIPLGGSEEPELPPVIRMPPAIVAVPGSPVEGHLFVIRVRASEHAPLLGVHGDIAGEELHFRRVDDRSWESFAPAPVASTSVSADLRFVYATGEEARVTETFSVTPVRYSHERLSVAPRFGSPLDSADQARLDRDRERARLVAAVAHRTPWADPGEVRLPRASRVTSGFGDGRIFNDQVSSRHMGLDLRGARGDTVWAAARGVVSLSDQFLLAGNLVYLNHGAALVTGYFHLSRSLVSVGDTVEPGDPIGLVGATGRVTGPHLHWVLRYGSTSLDPRSLLDVVGSPSDGG